ncbi:MAG: NAD+ synthase [Candidatus Omnitrophica bacterium]|nr:NAD+ synthase [Candidatus Omnitrophota bacterium]
MPIPPKLCLAQINTTVGDLAGNQKKILESLRFARSRGANLVTFPELAVTGYPPEDLLFKEKFVSKNLETLRALIPHTGGLAAVVGFVDRDRKGLLYNAAAFIGDQKLLCVYRKKFLPNYGVFDEKRYFAPGDEWGVVNWRGTKIALTICEDIWPTDSGVYAKNYPGRRSLLINISASPVHAGKQAERLRLVKNLARTTGSTVIYHNLVGGQDELVFDGGSLVVAPDGRILAEAGRFEEDFILSNEFRGPAPALKRGEEVYRALVLGTRDYLHKNRFQKALIGLSGGIDSALVAAIAVDALGKENVIGVTMPSRFTSKETLRDAKILSKNLGIACHAIPMDEIFSTTLKTLKPLFAGLKTGLAEENLQARIRGNLLMALSNKFGHLVLTTGNKSEMATGYCTLYGDMAGGFAVIKDVPKTLVFKLARYRNRLSPKNVIPQSVLRRPPSAELRPNQKDRDSLPPYAELDKFLELYVEKDLSADAIIRRGLRKDVVYRAARMVDGNEYKRRQSPPGVKITPKAFGRDRRMPITNRYAP